MSMLHQHFVTRLLLTTFYPFRKSLFIGFFNVSKYSGRYIIYMYARERNGGGGPVWGLSWLAPPRLQG